MEKFEIQKAAEWVWGRIEILDEYIAREEPFKVVKVDAEKGRTQIEHLLSELANVAFHLQPLMPNTAGKILSAIEKSFTVKSVKDFQETLRLFPRVV